jgi:hypothetical protein
LGAGLVQDLGFAADGAGIDDALDVAGGVSAYPHANFPDRLVRPTVTSCKRVLAPRLEAVQIAAEMMRLRGSAERLVRSEWAQLRIERIAAALLERGTLSGEDIAALS